MHMNVDYWRNMEIHVGNFTLIESVTVIVRSPESIYLSPFNGLIKLVIEFSENDCDKSVWNLKTIPPNLVTLDLINHQTATFGGTSTDNVPLGSIDGKKLLLRYAYHPFGDTQTSRTWSLTCNFGESDD